MEDRTTHDDVLIRVEPESPPQRLRELSRLHPLRSLGHDRTRLTIPLPSAGTPHDSLWSLSMPGAWPTNFDGPPLSSRNPEDYIWEVNQDRAYSIFASQPSGTLSPIEDMLGDFSFDQPPGATQEVHPGEQYNGTSLYTGEPYRASTPSFESSSPRPITFPNSPPFSQDPSHHAEVFEQRGSLGGSYSFLTDGSNATTYSTINPVMMDSSLDQWKYRGPTPSSSLASPVIGTPSPLDSALSSLTSSPFHQSPNIVELRRNFSPLLITDDSFLSSHKNGYPQDRTYLDDIPFERYKRTGSAGLSHPTSATHSTTSLNPESYSLLSPLHASDPSHAPLRSAPPSPSLPPIYRGHDSVESGTRRHSDSSGSDHRTMALSAKLAKFRQDTQAEAGTRDLSSLLMGSAPQPTATSQTQPVDEGSASGEEVPSSMSFKGVIASPATLVASEKRRKKNALFACPRCPQKLTSKDNLNSHIDAHNGLKRFLCIYCSRRFRTRSVLTRHQKSKKCPASALPQLQKK